MGTLIPYDCTFSEPSPERGVWLSQRRCLRSTRLRAAASCVRKEHDAAGVLKRIDRNDHRN